MKRKKTGHRLGACLLSLCLLFGSFPLNLKAEGQYHFAEGDYASLIQWKEQYLPNGYEDLLKYDQNWWDNLYDHERELAEFLKGLIVELPKDIYTGQELSECISILESGVEAAAFFEGTVFSEVTLEDLYAFQEEDMTMDDIMEFWSERPTLYSEEEGEKVAKMGVSYTGYNGTGHGKIYKLTLGGEPTFCLSMGKAARNGFVYQAGEGTYEEKNDGLGMLIHLASSGTNDYVCVQIAIWLYQISQSYTKDQILMRAAAMLDISSEEAVESMAESIWAYYRMATTNTRPYYAFTSKNSSAQVAGTRNFPETYILSGVDEPDPEEPDDTSVTIRIHKTDWQTEVGLPGCEVDIFEDGNYLTRVTTDENGEAVYTIQKSEEDFYHKNFVYSIREVTAPYGYVFQENEKAVAVTSVGSVAEFEITNERTLGRVELIKYDRESESDRSQGDAVFDGAVYGIYAAEDIVHQDQVTGVIYKKDELVQTAVIGRSPRLQRDGYIRNKDGSRHVENVWEDIAYENTPGRTRFGDLELGHYYIREIKPSPGYMLDESRYEVFITYEDQMIKVEKADTVYSHDHVVKQGISFIKTTDNTFQTELQPLEGAGFSVYLLSALSGVKNGALKMVGEAWDADDIQNLSEYDFSEEQTAIVYKRIGCEEWTDGDKKWLVRMNLPNQYRVGEMFTDSEGRIESPELPYGTYVFVETTVPEYHTAAKPFLVYVTEDGGVLYTDATKKTIEKRYSVEEAIRYGDHVETKEREGRVLQKQRIINNTITKTFLRVVKTDEEFLDMEGTYLKPEQVARGTVFKEGATYRLRCLTMKLSGECLDALNWKYDENGYLSYYDPNAKYTTGTLLCPWKPRFLKKDGIIQDCYITLPQELPVGTYELQELNAPEGYVLSGKEQSVKDTGSDRINGYEIIDTPEEPVQFTINNKAVYPEGQMGMDKYTMCDAYGNLTVTILQKNQAQKGIIQIYKHGEQLADIQRDMQFVYEDAPVEGATFHIVAAEDIYTQELQKDLFAQYAVDSKDYLIHQKGDVVAAITTDRYGFGYAEGLHIGKYKIRETVAGTGFALNTVEKEFVITPQEQTVSFDIRSVDYKNERQKLELEVLKKDSETGAALKGAVFGLYAAEDIYTNIEYDTTDKKWIVRKEPKLLLEKGTLIVKDTTDADGRIIFEKDLPLGKYEIRELEAPEGYRKSSESILLDGRYDSPTGGQNVFVQKLRADLENEPGEPELPKPPEHSGDDDEEDTEDWTEQPYTPSPTAIASPVTGDETSIDLWCAAALLAAGILICYVKSKR